ncbi:sigma-70 family RNA polymerase sigma factor [Pseudomonas helleri]|uniref:sigma-70 family RNA polymerase sigma factor n=1 Tax=Pseudomonas helleri TaxID=1608996 RepID=UPI0038263B62
MSSSPSNSSLLHADVRNLYSDHHHWLVNWLRRRLRNAENADDMAQDTFLYVLGKPEQVAQLREPRAWLSSIAKGLMIDRYRRQQVEQAYLQALAHVPEQDMPSPEERLILLETLTRIDALLDGLKPNVRTAFLLSRLEGLGYQAIAERLEVSVSSVEKYMATAIRHCFLARAAL